MDLNLSAQPRALVASHQWHTSTMPPVVQEATLLMFKGKLCVRTLGLIFALFSATYLCACAAVPGPDKSAAGAAMGAGWGAGAGAVLGNQFNSTGPGALIGMGFGAAGGLLSGIGLDVAEGSALEEQRELDALRAQVEANQSILLGLRDELDSQRQKQITGMP